MKTPKRKSEQKPPEAGGGKALERLRFFEQQRGIAPTLPRQAPAPPKPQARKKSR